MIVIHDDHFYIMLHSFFSSALASVTTIIVTNLCMKKKNNLHFLTSFLFILQNFFRFDWASNLIKIRIMFFWSNDNAFWIIVHIPHVFRRLPSRNGFPVICFSILLFKGDRWTCDWLQPSSFLSFVAQDMLLALSFALSDLPPGNWYWRSPFLR